VETLPKPSFSSSRRWSIKLNVGLGILAVVALVAMANYLAEGYSKRFQWGSTARIELSAQTVRVLQSVTNRVDVTIFFDRKGEEELYTLVSSLLKEYNYVNPNVQVRTVDYTRYTGAAEEVLAKYNLVNLKDKNFIVFDNQGRSKVVFGIELSDYDIAGVLSGETSEFRRSGFRGEMLFSAALFRVTFPHLSKAYFLQGHGEHQPQDPSGVHGYGKFAALLSDQNNVLWETLSLQTNDVPADCQLLIIAGPSRSHFLPVELDRLDHYLRQGGRLLVLMSNMHRAARNTGIERLLARWGIGVDNNIVSDPEYYLTGHDLLTAKLNPEHPITRLLATDGSGIRLVSPRAVYQSADAAQTADAPKVTVLATTSDSGLDDLGRRAQFPLIVAMEQGNIPGVSTERGATRLVVVGDSLGLDNEVFDSVANYHFANQAVNWLLERHQMLLADLGPRPVRKYQLLMTQRQMNLLEWLFLAGMPGAVLLLGGFIWLRRRS
jgi:hypothetical protein